MAAMALSRIAVTVQEAAESLSVSADTTSGLSVTRSITAGSSAG